MKLADTGAVSYSPQLAQVIGVLGNIAITVSGVTPTASVFIIAPVAYSVQGSGSFLDFLIAAIVGIGMAMSWAELGALFPTAGGDYAIVSRVLGRPVGFIVLAIWLALALFIPSSIALGSGQYVDVLFPGVNANLAGTVILLLTTLVAIFSIRLNAVVTGVFLVIEMLAVGTVTVLGFVHIHQPLSILTHPQTAAAGSSGLTAVAAGVVIAGIATAIFSYNGYSASVVFSEEMTGSRSGVARAVYWSLAITVAAEFIPVTAALLGAPSLHALATSAQPMSYVITSLSNSTINKIVSAGVILAIFNGNIAIVLTMGRIVYASARDRAWPEVINRPLDAILPRFRTPWIATALVGIVGAILTATSNIAALVTFTGLLLVIVYGLIALSAIVSRYVNSDLERPYRMPLWPVGPVVGLAGTALVATQQKLSDLIIVGAIVVVAGIYYAVFLQPRSATNWVMRKPVYTDDSTVTTELRRAAADPSDPHTFGE